MESDESNPSPTRRDSHYNQQRSIIRPSQSSSRAQSGSRTPRSPRSPRTPRESHHADPFEFLTDVTGPPPIENPQEGSLYRHESLEDERRRRRQSTGSTLSRSPLDRRLSRRRRRSSAVSRPPPEYYSPQGYENLNEVFGPVPVENPDELALYRHETLEDSIRRSASQRRASLAQRQPSRISTISRRPGPDEENITALPSPHVPQGPEVPPLDESWEATIEQAALGQRVSQFATQLYTISYLILFSMLGTLTRLGLQWLTFYPGAPIVTGVLWANFAGTFFIGFLSEDRRLFEEEWGNGSSQSSIQMQALSDEEQAEKQAAARMEHARIKKTIPLYIGLATGFCGSLTSFSSFMRDVFFAISNNLPAPISHTYPPGVIIPSTTSTVSRHAGDSFMAACAIILLTLCLCLSALKFGAHFAIFLDPWMPSLPFIFLRKIFDRLVVILAFGCWLGAIIMAIWPPDRPGGPAAISSSWSSETWRGQAIFACVFAPLGCLLRFYASIKLNGISPSFPLGTFAVNIFGTAVLGMAYDLQHVNLGGAGASAIGGGRAACQLLQGIMDGFDGCLTTVSTFVAELTMLRRNHSYRYGSASILAGMGVLLAVMGSVRWSVGWSTPSCL